MSDIVVKRFNVNKEARDQIKTRIVYAPKQRVLNDLLDKDQNLQLPAISVQVGGIAKDDARVFNKILGTYYTPAGSSSSINDKSPLPVDVTYNVSIMTRYQQDMDQIISHIIPYVNPYFVVSWRTPNRPEHEIRSTVQWNGNVNIQYPIDQTATQVARVVADLSFTFKGWLFQNLTKDANIFTFNASFIKASSMSEYLTNTDINQSSEAIDAVVYNAVPPKPKTIEPYSTTTGKLQQFSVWGEGFERVVNVYLSGAPLAGISTLQNPFSASPVLSSVYAPFLAVKLLSSGWTTDKGNFVTFVMPSADVPGRVDLIIENPNGLGSLVHNVRVNNFNPFSVDSPEYTSFVPYQLPYLSGIQIF